MYAKIGVHGHLKQLEFLLHSDSASAGAPAAITGPLERRTLESYQIDSFCPTEVSSIAMQPCMVSLRKWRDLRLASSRRFRSLGALLMTALPTFSRFHVNGYVSRNARRKYRLSDAVRRSFYC